MIVIQLKIAPDRIPLAIIGTVIPKNVLILEAPRLREASSTEREICCKVATEERMVYGILRMTRAMIMMATVPVRTKGLLLKLITRAIPTTEPGIMYGSMEQISIVLLIGLFLLTTR